jgi:hypothetical protein
LNGKVSQIGRNGVFDLESLISDRIALRACSVLP